MFWNQWENRKLAHKGRSGDFSLYLWWPLLSISHWPNPTHNKVHWALTSTWLAASSQTFKGCELFSLLVRKRGYVPEELRLTMNSLMTIVLEPLTATALFQRSQTYRHSPNWGGKTSHQSIRKNIRMHLYLENISFSVCTFSLYLIMS